MSRLMDNGPEVKKESLLNRATNAVGDVITKTIEKQKKPSLFKVIRMLFDSNREDGLGQKQDTATASLSSAPVIPGASIAPLEKEVPEQILSGDRNTSQYVDLNARIKRLEKSLYETNLLLQSQMSANAKSREKIPELERKVSESYTVLKTQIDINKELIKRISTTSNKNNDDSESSESPSTSVLKKMYTFFVRTNEEDRRKEEIEKDFQQKRTNTDRRKKQTATKLKQETSKPKNNPILELLGFLGSGLGKLVSFVTGGLFGLISSGLTGLKNVLMSIPGIGFLGRILGTFASLGEGLFNILFGLGRLGWKSISFAFRLAHLTSKAVLSLGEIVFNIGKTVGEVIFKVLDKAGGFIFKRIFPFLSKTLEVAFNLFKKGGGAVGRGLLQIGRLLGPVGSVAAIGALAYEGVDALQNYRDSKIYGDEFQELQDKEKEISAELEIKKAIASGSNVDTITSALGGFKNIGVAITDPDIVKYTSVGTSDVDREAIRKKFNDNDVPRLTKELDETKQLKATARDDYVKNVVTPAFESRGYHQTERTNEKGVKFISYAKNEDNKNERDPAFVDYAPVELREQNKAANASLFSKEYFDEVGRNADKYETVKTVLGKQASDTYQSAKDKVTSTVDDAEQFKNEIVDTATQTYDTVKGGAETGLKELESVKDEAYGLGESVKNAVTPTATPEPSTMAPAPASSPVVPRTSSPVGTPSQIPAVNQPSIPAIQKKSSMQKEPKIIVEKQQTTNNGREEKELGTASVRNPNPVIYRTVMMNDRALV